MTYSLNGKVALVTGAGGKNGLGRAIALRLATEGANVAVNDIVPRRAGAVEWAGLSELVNEIETLGHQAIAVIADVSESEQVGEMVQQVLDRYGRIDILVNNAGAPAGRDRVPVIELEEDAWDLVQRVNVKGTFLCSQAVAKIMIGQRGGGRIINISSTSGQKGVPRFAAYSASKFAIRGFSQSLAQELAPYNITVNAVCPGLIETERIDDMAAALAPDGVSVVDQRERLLNYVVEKTPLGRIGKPEDVANMVAFLASSEADFLTGISLTVAGGSLTT